MSSLMQNPESVLELVDKISSSEADIDDSQSPKSDSYFNSSIIKTTESKYLENKPLRNSIISIYKKLFPEEKEISDLYLENDDQKLESIKDKILNKIDQLLKINNKYNTLNKKMLIELPQNQTKFLNTPKKKKFII